MERPYLNPYHLHHFTWDGDDYPTVMHAFYAARCKDRSQRRWIRACPSPTALDWMIKQVEARPDWETVKADIMEEVIRAQYADPDMAHWLLITMDAQIVDQYLPDNLIGKTLMKVREAMKHAA